MSRAVSLNRRQVLVGAGGLAAVASVAASAVQAASGDGTMLLIPPEPGAQSLDGMWRFHKGDIPSPRPLTHRGSYDSVKSGNAIGAAGHSFDDMDWRLVDLPHDWAIEVGPVPTENLAQGFRARGIGWYRRSFRLDPAQRGHYLELQFGGIATNATVWFNGDVVAHNWSGYTSIYIDITSLAVFGEDNNTIAIRVDADTIEGWWYEGAGLYRHSWLISRPPVHATSDGIHADPRRNTAGDWRLPVEVDVYSIKDAPVEARLTLDLVDRDGKAVATTTTAATLAPLTPTPVRLELDGLKPHLWSVDAPYLYQVRLTVHADGDEADVRTQACGFREARFDAQAGFFLNSEPLKIKGVCLHQDHAGVGVAVPDALVHWRVQQLKALGCNAIRSAHNAPSTALLDACDALGVLVLDENRHFNAAPDYAAQLAWLIRRDRNRPSVILWSIFNEEPSEGTAVGYEMARRLTAVIKALDDSRPVTAAMSSGAFTPVNVGQAVDVVGFNYQQTLYDPFHAHQPTVPVISTEDTSAFMTRGAVTTDRARHVLADNDSEFAVWGASQRRSWREIQSRPFVAGGFVWTGFDYHGEPTPFDWPSNSSCFGLLDLCGFPKAAFYIRQALWVEDRPILRILTPWSGQARETTQVFIATNLEQVDLLLNGRLVGSQKPRPFDMTVFPVVYEAGHLEARGWKGGKVVAVHSVDTPGPARRIRLTPSRAVIRGDGHDSVPITIEVTDGRNRPLAAADDRIVLTVENGRLIGGGNGDPTSLASGNESDVRLFNGLAQAIVQSNPDSQGQLVVTAMSWGLGTSTLSLRIEAGAVPRISPAPARFFIKGWRQSPLVSIRPTAPQTLADNDMNSWAIVSPGDAPPFSAGTGYVTLVAGAGVPAAIHKTGGTIVFERINGAGELWLDGHRVATKPDAAGGPLRGVIPAGLSHMQVTLILEARPDLRTGLPGLVFIEAGG